ncbi:hypothetical protein K7E08_02000 [Ligilactobacillus salivarius]|uniref:hypothetical protein n=1 Tax=Ligilactobacillus salivarius TaxID=1624 RepID=UPI001CC17CA9|nr:hypothetical protein [Ligilactobacillus salivarius]MBZ4029743.1 hypothetical protein [Ligilactobacillus salivarius]
MDRLYFFMNKKVIEENQKLAEENHKLKRLIRSYRQVIADLQTENMSLEKALFEEEFEDDGTEIPADLWDKF